ncbi:MAG: hypothetical protein U0163_06210 [Gemmatimonadaceae bacterium]
MKRWFLVASSLVLMAGVAQAQDAKPEKPKFGGANRITQEEVEYSKAANALEAIQRLRPRMLQRRLGSSTDKGEAGEIVVRVDNARFGYPDQLSSFSAERIKEIRYVSPSDATTQWGTGYTEGAIWIITKDGK